MSNVFRFPPRRDRPPDLSAEELREKAYRVQADRRWREILPGYIAWKVTNWKAMEERSARERA